MRKNAFKSKVTILDEIDFINTVLKEPDTPNADKAFSMCLEGYMNGNYEYAIPLSKMYYYGIGTSVDYYSSINVLKKASDDTGQLSYSRELANVLYNVCISLEKDCFRITSELAKKKDARSIGILGRLYRDAIGTEANIPLAIDNLRKAYKKNLPWAGFELMDLLIRTKNDANQKEAFDICTEMAEKNNPKAMGRLGRMYRDGIGTPVNKEMAIFWLRRASNENIKWATVDLYKLLEE